MGEKLKMKKYKLPLYLLGALGAMGLLLKMDFRIIYANLTKITGSELVVLLCFQLLSMGLIAIQWQRIIVWIGGSITFKEMFLVNLAGTFVESITPSVKAGGEVTKVLLIKKHFRNDTGQAFSAVTIQKTFSALVFTFLCLVSVFYYVIHVSLPKAFIGTLVLGIVFSVLILSLLVALVLTPKRLIQGLSKVPFLKKRWAKVTHLVDQMRSSVHTIKGKKYGISIQLLLSLFIWLLFPFKTYLIISYLQLSLDFFNIVAITFLTYMIGMVPLLPGGLGTFEASMVFLLLPLGFDAQEGMALALILRFVTYWFVFFIAALAQLFKSKLLIKSLLFKVPLLQKIVYNKQVVLNDNNERRHYDKWF